MTIPAKIKVVEDRLGNQTFFIRPRTFTGGVILLLFANVWLSILSLFAMDFSSREMPLLKTVAIGALLLCFAAVGLGIFYLGLFCWFGTVRIKIENGMFYYFSGIFGIGRRIQVALADIENLSILHHERHQKRRTIINYNLAVKLSNGRQKKIPFADDFAVAKFFLEYLQERI